MNPINASIPPPRRPRNIPPQEDWWPPLAEGQGGLRVPGFFPNTISGQKTTGQSGRKEDVGINLKQKVTPEVPPWLEGMEVTFGSDLPRQVPQAQPLPWVSYPHLYDGANVSLKIHILKR